MSYWEKLEQQTQNFPSVKLYISVEKLLTEKKVFVLHFSK